MANADPCSPGCRAREAATITAPLHFARHRGQNDRIVVPPKSNNSSSACLCRAPAGCPGQTWLSSQHRLESDGQPWAALGQALGHLGSLGWRHLAQKLPLSEFPLITLGRGRWIPLLPLRQISLEALSSWREGKGPLSLWLFLPPLSLTPHSSVPGLWGKGGYTGFLPTGAALLGRTWHGARVLQASCLLRCQCVRTAREQNKPDSWKQHDRETPEPKVPQECGEITSAASGLWLPVTGFVFLPALPNRLVFVM